MLVHIRASQAGLQGAIDEAMKGSIITASEVVAMTATLTILLSMLGVNLGNLLMPAAFACAYAAKDLTGNFFAGACLFLLLQPALGRVHCSARGARWPASVVNDVLSLASCARLVPRLRTGVQASSCLRCSPSSWATGWLSVLKRARQALPRPGSRASARRWTSGAPPLPARL